MSYAHRQGVGSGVPRRSKRSARVGSARRLAKPVQVEEAWQAKLRHDFVIRLLENRLDFGVMVPVAEVDVPRPATEAPPVA
ncbi:hypothetical protein [Roseomonas rosulenta]|uniref:hypothetical protein n=1 Tax=Roseomonas rosulenta TaxID=2748667 RepID=UPI0018DF8B2C|nr:hypothetical protein [Roseomonas rosulenta]